MAKKLYVGNLSFGTNDDQLREHFAQFGTVTSATILMDQATGRSRGFGFVEMENDAEADEAIKQLNQKEFEGRELVVNEARPRTDAPRGPRAGGMGGGNRRFGGDRDQQQRRW